MGLFSDLKKNWQESPGRVLLIQLQRHAPRFQNLPVHIKRASILSFISRKNKILKDLDNMTPEGAIKTGIQLQRDGLETIDFNISEGYAIWFTGVWLESMFRPGNEARTAHETMLYLEEEHPF